MKKLLLVSTLLFLGFTDLSYAESLILDLGKAGGATYNSKLLYLLIGLTILTLAPSIIMMVTSFTRIVVVFGLLRTAIGMQTSPPNTILISLALFLTSFIMMPTLEKSYQDGIKPLIEGQISEEVGWERTMAPLHSFMLHHVRETDLRLFMDMSKTPQVKEPKDIPLRTLTPAFMISELRRAFEIGFLVFIPFLIIDMVVASVLMSMGMMMLPPIIIALPFKIIFFVLVDGWNVVAGSLVKSFGVS